MKKQSTSPSPAGNGPALSNGFLRFWFTPTDPTTLGMMRIIAGLVILYIHLAYCFDLRSFFGPNAWYSLEQANRDRQEWPWMEPSLNTWEQEHPIGFVMPTSDHRRQAIIEFLHRLPDEPGERKRRLEYIYRLPAHPMFFEEGIAFIERMPVDPQRQANELDHILNVGPEDPLPPGFPRFIRELPMDENGKKERDYLHRNAISLLQLMPPNREQRRYVLEWFSENRVYPAGVELERFIQNLPRDPVERAAVIDYLDHWNMNPAKAAAQGMPIWSIWFHVTSKEGMWTVHIIVLVLIALFTVGFCTKVTGILVWLAALSYLHRTQQVLFGVDVMMNIALLYLIIGPSGATLSIDRLIQRYRIIRASYRRSGRIDEIAKLALAGPAPSVAANVATRMGQVHFCFIYAASGLAKLKGDSWWLTTSIWLTGVNPEFSPVNVPWYAEFMRFMASTPLTVSIMTSAGVAFTLFIEIGFPFLVWTRIRPYMVMGSILLHFGIALIMGLTVFSLMMFALVLVFVPPAVIRERLNGGTDLPRLRLRFQSDDRKQLRRASWVGAWDVNRQVELIDEAGQGTRRPIEVIGSDSERGSGFGAFALLLRKVRLMRWFVWLLWLPGFAALGRALYGNSDGGSTSGAEPKAKSVAAR